MGPSYKSLKPTPSDTLPPARFCLLKVPQPFQIVVPAGDQVFKLMSLWGDVHVHVQTTMQSLMVLISFFVSK